MPSIFIRLVWLLATIVFSSAVVAETPQPQLTPETVNATLLGETRFDQMRFLQCVKNDPNTFGRMVAYYDHPPQGSEKPTQVALKQFDSVPWGKGCSGGGISSDGAGWTCDIDQYEWSKNLSKAFVGSVTYGFTGFNCFVDNGHGAHHEGSEYGMCYSELYCTRERGLSLAVDASKETVKIIHRSTVIGSKQPNLPAADARGQVKNYLQQVKKRIGEQQCNPTEIPLTPECNMKVDCGSGKPEYLEKLANTLITIYDTDKDLFKGIETTDCTSQQPICDPFTGKCREQPDICDYTKGVEMPASYRLSIVNRPPPYSDEDPPAHKLNVDLQCHYYRNDAMCDAMSRLMWGFGLYGPLSGLFRVSSLGIKAGCM